MRSWWAALVLVVGACDESAPTERRDARADAAGADLDADAARTCGPAPGGCDGWVDADAACPTAQELCPRVPCGVFAAYECCVCDPMAGDTSWRVTYIDCFAACPDARAPLDAAAGSDAAPDAP